MNQLAGKISDEIRAGGAISCARFMEMALYEPGLGYYERHTHQIGTSGDFFTSVSVGPLFGELLARQFLRWATEIPLNPLRLLEAGAHDGRLATDVLEALQRLAPETFAALEYVILEPSPARAADQRERLQRFAPRVRWVESWEDTALAGFEGVMFSNELLDAFPIHRYAWDKTAQGWMEMRVGEESGRFVWRKTPVAWSAMRACGPDSDQSAPLDALFAVLPDGFVVETCPAGLEWWSKAARTLRRGWLLTLDYGHSAVEYWRPERADGTLRAYRAHRVLGNVLDEPGEQDLTAHVNFTAVRQAGEAEGLRTVVQQSQGQFLRAILEAELGRDPTWAREFSQRLREFQTLTHPEFLGRPFQVLAQRR